MIAQKEKITAVVRREKKMRLIDADALLTAIIEYPYGYRGMIKSEIENQPTVDAVPVIRCRDCARNPKYTARTHCPCPMDRYMGDDGWCAMARRKEE